MRDAMLRTHQKVTNYAERATSIHKPLEAFGGRKRSGACVKKNRAYRRRSKKRANTSNPASADNDELELSSGDELKEYGGKQFTEEEDKILGDGIAAQFKMSQISAVSFRFLRTVNGFN